MIDQKAIAAAIEALQDRYMTVSMCITSTECKAHNRAIDTALACMRECAERREGCEWCEEPPTEWKSGDKVYGYTSQYFEYGDGDFHYVCNKYCPMCGRDLERS